MVGKLRGEGLKISVVVSQFNQWLTDKLLEGALQALRKTGASQEEVLVVKVPGAFELPQAARSLATSGKWDAVICLGVIIKGETPHFEYLSNAVANGIERAAVETGVPVAFGVLTTETAEQAIARCGIKQGNKGYEAALVAVEMANLGKQLQEL
ncbi:MAG: 6,7-dimethyl-8-ribityllumazine synthase [Acidobacteria bacterium]|nr:6,7-dimethyl-8-ribityllumazine synthase [Acidobacteriota bacterium]